MWLRADGPSECGPQRGKHFALSKREWEYYGFKNACVLSLCPHPPYLMANTESWKRTKKDYIESDIASFRIGNHFCKNKIFLELKYNWMEKMNFLYEKSKLL